MTRSSEKLQYKDKILLPFPPNLHEGDYQPKNPLADAETQPLIVNILENNFTK